MISVRLQPWPLTTLILLAGLAWQCSGSGNNDDDTPDDDDVTSNDDDDTGDDTADDDDDDTVPEGPFVENLHIAYLDDPSTMMGISWKREAAMPGAVVQWGLSEDALEESVTPAVTEFGGDYIFEDTSGKEIRTTFTFKAKIEGLLPDTTYHYRVGDGSEFTDTYSFTTAPEPGVRLPVEFIVLGDNRGFVYGLPSPVYPAIVSQVKAESFDFLLNTGDMVFVAAQSEWDQFFQASTGLVEEKPWMVCQGNHDAATLDSFLRNHYLPGPAGRTYYSFDYANLHIISLDTEDDTLRDPATSPQVQWLREDLEATDQEWIMAFFHKGTYNSSQNHGSLAVPQKAFVPLFNEFGVDVVFLGHDHIYDRTQFLHGLTEPLPENMLPEGGGTKPAEMCIEDCVRGTMYITAGGAGAGTYKVFDPPLDHSVLSKSTLNYVKVTIDGDRFDLVARDEQGAVIDTYGFNRFNAR